MIKQLRQQQNLTQKQLSEMTGINIRQIQKIESGEIKIGNVTLANAVKLSTALHISLDELYKNNL